MLTGRETIALALLCALVIAARPIEAQNVPPDYNPAPTPAPRRPIGTQPGTNFCAPSRDSLRLKLASLRDDWTCRGYPIMGVTGGEPGFGVRCFRPGEEVAVSRGAFYRIEALIKFRDGKAEVTAWCVDSSQVHDVVDPARMRDVQHAPPPKVPADGGPGAVHAPGPPPPDIAQKIDRLREEARRRRQQQ